MTLFARGGSSHRKALFVLSGYLTSSLLTVQGAFHRQNVMIPSLRPSIAKEDSVLLPFSVITMAALHNEQSNECDGDWTSSSPSMKLAAPGGVAVLLTVPVAWGTFEVAIRSVYALEPKVPAVLFALAYYTVASLALLLVVAVVQIVAWVHGDQSTSDQINNEWETTSVLGPHHTNDTNTALKIPTIEWPIQGGFELGFYLFIGNLCQMMGLQTVTADRAAFLLQLTTIFVPLAQATVIDQKWSSLSFRVWLACAVALTGVGVMSLDEIDTKSSSFTLDGLVSSLSWDSVSNQFHWATGDTLVVLAAVAYTFHCIRLEVYAQSTWSVALGACKATTETLWSSLTVAVVILVATQTSWTTLPMDDSDRTMMDVLASTGQNCLDYVHTIRTSDVVSSSDSWHAAIAAVIWTGLVPVAYTIVAQSYGQGVGGVRPVTANLIYTIQPIFTAVFAYLVLHESLGLPGFVGGALIGAAVLLVVVPQEKNSIQDGAS